MARPVAPVLGFVLDDALMSCLDSAHRRGRIVPELRAEGLEMYRELVVSKYRVLFRVRGREVVLLGVLDGRRDLAELLIQRAMSNVI